MAKALNPRSPVPLYHQLASSLTAAIHQGLYRPGEKLPSEPSLASHYGVTRPTVRQATRLLAERRLVEARRGAGTFVRAPRQEVDLFSLAGALESFEKSGVAVSRTLLRKVERGLVPAGRAANPFSGRIAYQFKRLSRVGRQPLLLEEFFVEPSVFPELELYDLSVKSFARVVREHYFMQPVRGRQTFQAQAVDPERQKVLRLLRGQPVLVVRRTLDFADAAAAVYAELYCRTDEFSFSQVLEGTP
jgi:GntR family transcriptional regulator